MKTHRLALRDQSDDCSGCDFDLGVKLGPGACPFNYLYWYFLMFNQTPLAGYPRMKLAYRTLGRMSRERRQEITGRADELLARL
jgi:deoxyribodipyrimidine photolyase-related protein